MTRVSSAPLIIPGRAQHVTRAPQAGTVSHRDGGSNTENWRRQHRSSGAGNSGGALPVRSRPKAAGRGRPGQKQGCCRGGIQAKVTKALIMGFASLWFALLEGRKLYELRRHAVDIPCGGLRVLLVCSKAVRKRFGLSCRMAEGMCYTRLGPFTADQIIKSPYLRGGVLASDDEIRKLLPANAGRQARGYLYRIVGVKMSKAKWGDCFGNGSNCLGFFDQYCGDQTRWTEQ